MNKSVRDWWNIYQKLRLEEWGCWEVTGDRSGNSFLVTCVSCSDPEGISRGSREGKVIIRTGLSCLEREGEEEEGERGGGQL